MTQVAVIDYGMGNLHSVAKALEHVGRRAQVPLQVCVTADPAQLRAADRLVFPGVGAMRDCMAEIRRLRLDDILREQVRLKPVLAICVGMQALLRHSEENGGVDCIGLFEGEVLRFTDGQHDAKGELLKVPHMGWNHVRQVRQHPLWRGIPDGGRFYFVHSYYVRPAVTADVAGVTDYPEPFCAALTHENVFAVQFHPEKSQEHGLQLLENFLTWNGQA
ncbi:MAG: imidazole glycerol phosphate synthase subunit HisH [Pseudomonadales bacterium]|jgi:glutamine amidotransferase|nr:imidazole glycerol phosphate synthase subunit HisH [Pseudomonadales bacterium]